MQAAGRAPIGQETEKNGQAQDSTINSDEVNNIYRAIGYKRTLENVAASSPVIEENNRMKGMIVAILGALAAGVIWLLIGYHGFFIDGLSVWIFLIAIKLYGKFAKIPDTFGNLCCSAVATVESAVAIYLYYGLWITKEMGEVGKKVSVWWVYRRLPDYLDRFDLWRGFIVRIVLGVLWSLLVLVYMSVRYIKELRSRKKSQKTESP